MKQLPEIGQIFEVPYPFFMGIYDHWDEDGRVTLQSWRPGTRNEMIAPDDCEAVADGMGLQILTIVGVYKPGRYPERVFFERRWRDPNGKEFGKARLHTKVHWAFKHLTQGFRYEFRLVESKAA